MPLTYTGLEEILLPRLPELLIAWLPGGDIRAGEYVCADLRGGTGDVLRVNLSDGSGTYMGQNFKSCIDLYASVRGIGDQEAAHQLAERFDYDLSEPNAPFKVDLTVKNGEEVKVVSSAVSLWDNLGLAISQSGNPVCNIDNVVRSMERHRDLKILLWYDEFHKKYFTNWNYGSSLNGSTPVREWSDVDEINLTLYVQRELSIGRINIGDVRNAIRLYGKRNTRNEPRDWMEGLVWDGTERVKWFFHEALGTEYNAYTYHVSHNFWVSMVARILRPGCKVDTMVILEGPQGHFKSTALDIIGGSWFAEMRGSAQNKDFLLALQGKMLVEISELESFRKAESTTLKQIISCRTDRYREPYGRATLDYPRMSIFVGTTNEKTYLKDDTGARRFWPVRCGRIDMAYIRENREQLFAEAVYMFRTGASWWEFPAGVAELEQDARRVPDEWEGWVSEYCVGRDDVTIRDVAVNSGIKLDAARLGPGEQRRIGAALRRAGYEKFHVKNDNGTQGSVWRRLTAENLPGV